MSPDASLTLVARARHRIARISPAGVVVRAGALGFASAAVMLLRLLERGEALSPRTALLIAILGAAGLAAGLLIYAGIAFFATELGRFRRFLVGGILGAGGVSFGFFLGFAFVRQVAEIEVAMDNGVPDSLRHIIIGVTIDAIGFFVTTGAPYLQPWPMAAVGLAAGLIALAPPAMRP